MLTREDFIRRILGEAPTRAQVRRAKKDTTHVAGFDFADDAPESEAAKDTRFAQLLLEDGFGLGQSIPRSTVIRSTDAVARYIPDRVLYWSKTQTRPHHTLLIEADLTHRELLAIPAFKSRQLAHLDIAEDAVARLVAEALEGFQRGAEGLEASALKGQKHETLCVVSIIDERDGHSGRLVCFGTFNAKTEGLETFFLTEHARTWDRADARERLALLYERQFKKLGEASWQEAFTTTDERKQAERLLEVCTTKNVAERDVQESILDLLDTIAKGFGLRKKPNVERRLQAFPLPGEHDIGIDSEEREAKYEGTNPFSGVTLRDEHSRLLGYIVYPLKTTADAARLRQHLEKHNRFHNVLVVYPDTNQASLELWQGPNQLTGKLRKGQAHKDAADVVNLLSRFFVVSKAKVRNPTELAQELAYRARYLRRLALKQLEDELEEGPLRELYDAFKITLVHDQTEDEFADAFAQTITYGLLTARWLGNEQMERFTRQSALKHLPAASPFLNDLFKSVLAVKLDEQRGRLLWLVDDIADLLDRIDVTYVFGAGDKDSDPATDPVIHFYEPFLAAYDKALKNKRGVFFTPRPVVSYIVRTVHELLQKEFGLEDGLASTDTWGDVAKRIDGLKIPQGTKATDPFVRVLDPATGTGTFIYECIEVIERTMKERWSRELGADSWTDDRIVARWNEYVPNHLLPRLYGFELMIASYAVAHLKVSFKLKETGYSTDSTVQSAHIAIYLTNSLDPAAPAHARLADLFSALSREAQAVNEVKRSVRFPVIVGNPPYSLLSANLDGAHRELVERYKFIGSRRMQERGALQMEKILNDDYVKFLSFTERALLASGTGVFGMITNHAYLDNPTMRGMRHHFLSSYSKLWLLDLGGSTKKSKAIAVDENVFDIQQGVCISVGIRVPEEHMKREVYHGIVAGIQASKYETLNAGNLRLCNHRIDPQPELYLFVPTDLGLWDEYKAFHALDDIFPLHSIGAFTSKDHFVIGDTPASLVENAKRFRDSKLSDAALCHELGLNAKKAWNVTRSRAQIRELSDKVLREKVVYFPHRPFDNKYIFYHRSLVWSMAWPVTKNLLAGNNLALITSRQLATPPWKHVYCSNTVVEMFYISNKTKEGNHVFPLFLADDTEGEDSSQGGLNLNQGRRANVGHHLIATWSSDLTLKWMEDGRGDLVASWGPVSLFEYVYAVLHSEKYRTRYEEFLVRAFARVPCANSSMLFRELSDRGRQLIALHLPSASDEGISTGAFEYRGPSRTKLTRGYPRYHDDCVWLSEDARIVNVPKEVWEWRVGVYQPCKKWLTDRGGGELGKIEIIAYRRMVSTIHTTIGVCADIDDLIDKHGGWPGAFVTKPGAS